MSDVEKLAMDLRAAAFPDAREWRLCAGDVRERWIAVARHAVGQCAQIADDVAAATGDGEGEFYIARKIAERIRALSNGHHRPHSNGVENDGT